MAVALNVVDAPPYGGPLSELPVSLGGSLKAAVARSVLFVSFVSLIAAAVFARPVPLQWLAASLAIAVAGGWLRHSSRAAAAARREFDRELAAVQRRAAAQDKLAELGMLAASIVHEINNPMTYVSANIRTLLADLRKERALPAAIQEYVDDLLPATLDGIQRVNSIVADLRRFARGDAQDFVPYDLNEEIRFAVRLTEGRVKDGCQVKVSLGELPRMVGQPRHVGQVVINLIVNAAQAMAGKAGTIEISSRCAGPDEACFSVRDDGAGMDEETRRRLFQPFFTTKRTGEGTGMGLAVIYGIVAAHGGRIDVESAPNRGSCFTVTLPRDPPRGVLAQTPSGTFRVDPLVARVAKAG
ncbi:MAG: sensor histidine kinase [Myxococcales bacterium]